MKYLIHVLLVFSLVLLGGCQLGTEEENTNPENMEADELPDVRAFEDEFTRSFIQSTEETRPGYYPFLSGTGAYTMDFPAGGVIGEKGYAKEEVNFESFLVGVQNDDGFASSIDVKYFSHYEEENKDSSLGILNSQFNSKLTFKELNLENKILYLAPFDNGNGVYGYAGYIQNKDQSGGIQIIYDTECVSENKECTDSKETNMKEILDWMKAVEFIIKNESE